METQVLSAAATANSATPASVLVADDAPQMRRILTLFLDHWGGAQVVAEAEDGEEAVRKWREFQPDLILMDYEMPKMDGVEALEQIRLECPGAKILIISMHDTDYVQQRVRRAGASGFVAKSDLTSRLRSELERLLA